MGASLIMPIGAQNAYVIRTGIARRHVLLTVATCIVVDISLIALGMAGFGALIEASPRLLALCKYGGAVFLLWYGLRCLASCWRGAASPVLSTAPQAGAAKKALGTVLAMSLLNPHVYLDTVVLLGAVGSGLALGERSAFAAGAMTASLLWFSMLGLVSRRYSGVLGRPAVWRLVEAFTGVTMLAMAGMLVLG
ncbi:MAG: LysE/ArgO family amino acid transporter [Massilia sp.]